MMTMRPVCTTALMLALLAGMAQAAFAAEKNDGVSDSSTAALASSSVISTSSSAAGALPEEPQGQNPYGQQSGVPPLPKAEKGAKPAKEGRTTDSVRPFSHVGVAVKFGLAGAGFDVATPLARKFNVRAGASFFSFDHNFVTDGTTYDASMRFKSAMLAVDWFPFGNAFRISPVVQFFNDNNIYANTSVAAGQSFTLNTTDYYSSVGSPITGTASFALGNRGNHAAPGVTMGFGNMIPRGHGQHWSVPFEIGFVYIQAPLVQLNLQGISCETQAEANAQVTATPTVPGCSSVATDPTTQSNVMEEQMDLTSDLNGLRFYPIFSIGLSYKF